MPRPAAAASLLEVIEMNGSFVKNIIWEIIMMTTVIKHNLIISL